MHWTRPSITITLISLIFILSGQPTHAQKCDPNEYRESLIMLQDYMSCIAGSKNDCTTMLTALMAIPVGVTAGSGMGLSQYSITKIDEVIQSILKDHKKLAQDKYYASRIEAEVGGEKVDKLVKQYGTIENAKSDVDARIKSLFSKEPKTQDILDNLEELNKVSRNLENRAGYVKSNANIIKTAASEIDKVNNAVVKKVEMLDLQIKNVERQLATGPSRPPKGALKSQLSQLKDQRSQTLKMFQGIDSQLKAIADVHNPQIDQMIKKMRILAHNNPAQAVSYNQMADILASKKIKPIPEATGKYSRLILHIDPKVGYGVFDANGKFNTFKDWAKEYRYEAIREFPKILQRSIKTDPTALHDKKKLLDLLADGEHERYRVDTRTRLINGYEYRREIMKVTGENLPEGEFELTKEGKAKPGAKLSQKQNELLNKYMKSNWLDVDIPFSKLSQENVDKTVGQVGNSLKTHVPFMNDGVPIKSYQEFFLKHPKLGALTRQGMRYGTQGALTALTFWFEWYDLKESAIQLAFLSENMRDKYSENLDYQCRMPKAQTIDAPNENHGYASYFCQCESTPRNVNKLHKDCQGLARELPPETRKACALAIDPGRDRDLKMALALKNKSIKAPNLEEIFKSAAGCDVMKNYFSNCHISTTNITDQGLYFLNIVRQNNLEKEVTSLCPDICSHWVDVAKRKVKQMKELNELTSLPENPSQNQPKETCPESFTQGTAPLNFEDNKRWKRCQPPIMCRADKSVRINFENGLRAKEYYEFKYDSEGKSLKSAVHFSIDFNQKMNERNNSYLEARTRKSFELHYDKEENLSHITLFDAKSGVETEKIPSTDILGRFNEYAYNANSLYVSGRDPGEMAVNRRLEVLVATRKVKNYCCQHAWKCATDDDDFTTTLPVHSEPAAK